MKKIREKFEEENINDHQMATNEGTVTDMFSCGRCKGRACTYNQVCTYCYGCLLGVANWAVLAAPLCDLKSTFLYYFLSFIHT